VLKGGLTITKKKETIMQVQGFTCSNPSCGRAFTNPIKAQNLASKESESYEACPYCLTKIIVEEEPSPLLEEKQEPDVSETKIKKSVTRSIDEKRKKVPSEIQGCLHHFGYLSKRSTKEKIPEECIVCGNIVQCMLQNITG